MDMDNFQCINCLITSNCAFFVVSVRKDSTGLSKVYSLRAELGSANDFPGQKEANGMFLHICLISGILMSRVSDEIFSSD
jgi:hypothetical protein